MNFYRTEEFLEDIISHVKFVFDREEIREELRDHMMDKIDYYVELGYAEEEAEKLTIKDMGDSKEIGVELNKEHSPIIGWIWRISHKLVVFFIIINILMLGSMGLATIFATNDIKSIPEDNIIYTVDLDEKMKIDDRVIKVTNIIYEKDGKMNIFYENYVKGFNVGKYRFEDIGTMKDDLGNEYINYSGSSSGGIIPKTKRTIDDFPPDANMLIIDYDRYNRKYTVEIPLKTGEDNE